MARSGASGARRPGGLRALVAAGAVGFAGLAAGALMTSAVAQTEPPAAAGTRTPKTELVFDEVRGKLSDDTPYRLRKPDNWNGTLISDLDFDPKADLPFYLRLIEEGFAISGTGRREDRRAAWDAVKDGTRVQEAMSMFKTKYGQPRRVIAFGESAGGGVAMNATEIFGDKIDGAVAMCATTAYLTGAQIFDVYFMFRTLLAPAADDLPIDNIPFDASGVKKGWDKVLDDAMKTDAGRARIAFALTAAQYHVWTVKDTPRPNPRNLDQFVRAIADTIRVQIPDRLTTMHLWERIPPHQIFGNDGADYTKYFDNGDPQYREAVRALYKKAGLDLKADLDRLAKAPRTVTNRAGATQFLDNPGRHEEGSPKVPLLRVHTIGDQNSPQAQVQVYSDAVNRHGLQHLYRSLTVDRGAHCNFTPGEELAAIQVMMDRLDTGEWKSVSPPAMNALAAWFEPGVEHSYVPTRLRPFNGEWRMQAFSKRFH